MDRGATWRARSDVVGIPSSPTGAALSGGSGMKRDRISVLAAAAGCVLLAACISDGGGPPESANTSRGPIEVWLSTNPEEVAWGEEVVASWNSQLPNE
jgi:hypothetical protein